MSQWIEWAGGSSAPVADTKVVTVRYRNGMEDTSQAGAFRWFNTDQWEQMDHEDMNADDYGLDVDYDIVAYAVPVSESFRVLNDALAELEHIGSKHFLVASQSLCLASSTKDLKLSILADEVAAKIKAVMVAIGNLEEKP